MHVDSNSSMYVLDGANGRVIKWIEGDSSGTVVAGGNGLGSSTNQINQAVGMFIDSNTSTIWIADMYNNRIVKWTTPTTSVVVCGSYGSNSNQFYYPSGLFIDTSNANAIYVADTYNHRIQMWLTGATSGMTVAGITGDYGNGLNQLQYPQTLMIDNNQNMFIVDRGNYRIMKWTIGASSGMIIAGDMTSGTQSNQLYSPMNINFDSNGSLFVADTYNNRIQKFLISCRKLNLYIFNLLFIFAAAVANISTTIAGKNFVSKKFKLQIERFFSQYSISSFSIFSIRKNSVSNIREDIFVENLPRFG